MELTAATAATLGFNFTGGALLLDTPSLYTGTLGNFAPRRYAAAEESPPPPPPSSPATRSASASPAAARCITRCSTRSRMSDVSVTIDGAGLTEGRADRAAGRAPASCTATRLLTASGERAIEDLRVGEAMVTLLGRRLARVAWVGSWQLDCARHPRPWDVHPVRVAGGGVRRRQAASRPVPVAGPRGVRGGDSDPDPLSADGATVAQVAMPAVHR